MIGTRMLYKLHKRLCEAKWVSNVWWWFIFFGDLRKWVLLTTPLRKHENIYTSYYNAAAEK